MKTFFKENFVLVLGISLPLILIFIFMIAQSFTKLIDPPQYKPVYALQQYYYGKKPFAFKVNEDGHLDVTYREPTPKDNHNFDNYQGWIYIYDPLKETHVEVELVRPENIEPETTVVIETPDIFKHLSLDRNKTSPDGFTFERYKRSGGSFFTDVFGYNSHRYNQFVLKKDGRYIHITTPMTGYYYGQEQFIGWAKSNEGNNERH